VIHDWMSNSRLVDIGPFPSMPAGESGAGGSPAELGCPGVIFATPIDPVSLVTDRRTTRSTWVGTCSPLCSRDAMSAALHDPPAEPALVERDTEREPLERRILVRRPSDVAAPVEPRRVRRTGLDELVPFDIAVDEAEPDEFGTDGAEASCRLAAWTPASAADQPIGRSDEATERRVTGATAAPGRGRAETKEGTRSPDDVGDCARPEPSGELAEDVVSERRTAVEAATPAAAVPAPMGAAAMAERARRAKAPAPRLDGLDGLDAEGVESAIF
jgi:hypothetical protein